MYIQRVKNISLSSGLSLADIARAAGVTRAAVTKWFRQAQGTGWVNVETGTVRNLAESLQLSPAYFLQPQADLGAMHTRFLWDALYESMDDFVAAIRQRELQALARLVQVLGFHDARAVAGASAVTLFARYKRFVKPARRRQLETLWPLYISKN